MVVRRYGDAECVNMNKGCVNMDIPRCINWVTETTRPIHGKLDASSGARFIHGEARRLERSEIHTWRS